MQKPHHNWTIAFYSFLSSHLLASSALIPNAVMQKNKFCSVGVFHVRAGTGPSLD